MHYYAVILGALCVWRITHLLQAEDGPWDVVVRLRRWAGQGFWGELLDCFHCLSLWVAAPFAVFLGEGPREKLLLWPALSAAAILLQRITEPGPGEPAAFFEESEDVDVMLRQEQGTAARSDAQSADP